ncbi:hypothetical protein ACA910_020664 [Epithemia clementina (nom. ined.)]
MNAVAMNTMFSVAGKNVLVTGGSRGIGYMIAKGFREQGANVLLTSRSENACKEAAETLDCQYVVSTLSNREGCEALAQQVGKVFNDECLHILVNNAGTSWGEPLERESGKGNWGFDKVFDLNVKAIFYLTRACLPYLEKAATFEDPARIINVGSVAGLIPQAAPTHAYDTSKAAVHQLTRKFAAEFAPKHITVNALAPGYVPSRMSAGLAAWGADAESLASTVPLKRLGNEDDMAGACIYLSSRAGSWVTGTVLTVDGGSVGAHQINLSSHL